jgi:hypothetical protein
MKSNTPQTQVNEKRLVEVERLSGLDGRIALVRMAKPPVNSLNTALAQELVTAINTLEQEPDTHGFILASSCNKVKQMKTSIFPKTILAHLVLSLCPTLRPRDPLANLSDISIM